MTAAQVLIYDSEGSYSHHERAPDRTHPALAPPQDDVHPMWGVHLHFPDIGEDGSHSIPHATLEWMCSWHGFDPDDLSTVVDVVLHSAHIPDADDVHAWLDPAKCWLMQAIYQDLPDPMTPGMPYVERRDVMLARVQAVKKLLASIDAASYEDRAGALYARVLAVLDVEARLGERGVMLPPQFKLGIDDGAADHPLDPILGVARLDPARVAMRRARDEWILDRSNAAVHRALTAMRSPMTFGVIRRMPPKVETLLEGLKAA